MSAKHKVCANKSTLSRNVGGVCVTLVRVAWTPRWRVVLSTRKAYGRVATLGFFDFPTRNEALSAYKSDAILLYPRE